MSSTIFFLISLLFCLSAISARPSPAIIYSARIYNRQNSTIECKITWRQPSGDNFESDLVQIEEKKRYSVKEKLVDMGSWTARAIITRIQCDHLVLTAPFEGVRGPSTNWIFVVRSNRIVSIKPKPTPS